MFRPFVMTFHFPGTMSADTTARWTAPMDCTLQHLSLNQSNAGSARVKLGTKSPLDDDDVFLSLTTAGVSGTPVELFANLGEFRFGVTPRIKKGDIVVLTVDHDGAAGTAAADLTVVLTFEEG